MRNWLAVGVVSVVSAITGVLGVGCSSASPVTQSEFCTQKAQAECGNGTGSGGGVVGVCDGLTVETCVSTRTSACIAETNVAIQNQRTLNPNNIPACLNAISAAYGNLGFSTSTNAAYSAVGPATIALASVEDTSQTTVFYTCESVYQGNIQANEPCTSDFDCANGNVCAPSNGGSKVTVCAPPINVADGESCGSAGSVCPSGDACVANKLGEYLCEASSASLGGKDAPCTSDLQCDPSTAGFCDIYAPKGRGGYTCQPGYQFGVNYDCKPFGGSGSGG
jgi:hypothetical protein